MEPDKLLRLSHCVRSNIVMDQFVTLKGFWFFGGFFAKREYKSEKVNVGWRLGLMSGSNKRRTSTCV